MHVTLVLPGTASPCSDEVDLEADVEVHVDVEAHVEVEFEVEVELRSMDTTVGHLLDALTRCDPTFVGPERGLRVDGRWHPADRPLLACGLRQGAELHLQPSRSTSHAGAVAEVAVVGGLQAGRRLAVHPGRHLLGRAGEVRLDHPTVSRHHLVLAIDPSGGAQIADLGARNGTRVDDRWVAGWTPVDDRRVIGIGALRLVVRSHPAEPTPPPARDLDGTVPVHRPPRRAPASPPRPVELPPLRRPPPPRGPFAWSAAAAPLLIGLVMATVFGPLFAAFALLSPVAVVGGWLEHRVRARRHVRREDRRLAADGQTLDAALAQHVFAEVARRHARHPDLALLARHAERRTSTVWERRLDHEDALVLRLGLGTARWQPTAPPPAGSMVGSPDAEPEIEAVVERHRDLLGVPTVLDLRSSVVGLVGAPDITRAVARSLVLQAAVLHGPADLRIEVPPTGPWRWARWLPHHEAGAPPGCGEGAGTPPHRLVVHDHELRRDHHDGNGVKAPAIVLAATLDELPAACGVVVEAIGADGLADVLEVATGDTTSGVLLDGAPIEVAAAVARRLAHLRDPEVHAGGGLPHAVGLGDLVPAESDEVRRAWHHPPGALPVALGATDSGPLVLDLVADGPHALVAGTTGAGKSELLRTLVVGLAAATGPDELAFVLVDFKGGSAFDRCADLPHVTGVITDLEGAMARRVLHGLEAEVRLREAKLRAVGAEDHLTFARQRGPQDEPLPRLVIVVDEFGVLATEAPEVLGGLVDVAQRGRSLGIHLVLATQRPSGVVTDRIRANTSLRIALRTIDASDSHDVLGTADAAAIDRRVPGRAFVRTGGDAPRALQVASSSAVTRDPGTEPVHVTVLPSEAGADDLRAPLDGTRVHATDLERLVGAIRSAAEVGGHRRARRPWTEPLPEHLAIADLPAPHDDSHLVLGRGDDVARLASVAWTWDPTVGHLVVHGASGSGVTTTLAVAARALHEAGWVVHALDPTGALLRHDAAPPWGSVVEPHDRGQVRTLASAIDEHRPGAPPVAVVVDRWHAVAGALDDLEGMRLLDAIVRSLARGPATGTVGLVGLDRATGLPPALAPAASQRLVLRLTDPHDLGLLGVPVPAWARGALPGFPPGRGVATPCGLEVQVALPQNVMPGPT